MTQTHERAMGPAYKSALVWLLCVPMLLLAGISFSSSQDHSGGDVLANADDQGATILGRIFLAVLLPIVVALAMGRYKKILSLASENKWVSVLLVIVTASTLWSQAPYRTVREAFWLVMTTIFGFWLATIASERRRMELFMVVGAIAAGLSILAVIVWPSRGLDSMHGGAWQGIFYSKNHCARMMVFFLTPALHINGHRRNWSATQIAYVVLILTVVLMSRSATGILLAAAYIVFAFGMRLVGKFHRIQMTALIGLGVACCIPIVIFAWEHASELFSMIGRDPSFSGRTTIWAVLLQSVKKRILLGYGFSAFWTGMSGEAFNAFTGMFSAMHFAPSYAHSGYLDVVLQIGVSGLAVLLFGLIRSLKDGLRCFTSQRPVSIDWYIGIILLTLIYNVDEVSFLLPRHLTWVMCIMACVCLEEGAAARTGPIRPISAHYSADKSRTAQEIPVAEPVMEQRTSS
jgi:O-antigen ligase